MSEGGCGITPSAAIPVAPGVGRAGSVGEMEASAHKDLRGRVKNSGVMDPAQKAMGERKACVGRLTSGPAPELSGTDIDRGLGSGTDFYCSSVSAVCSLVEGSWGVM